MPDPNKDDSSDLPKLRTYKQDVADTLRTENISVAGMAVQEQARRYKKEEETQKEIKSSKVFVILAGVLLLVGAITLAYVLFLRNPSQSLAPIPTGTVPEPLVRAEIQTLFDVGNKTPPSLYKELAGRVSGAGLKPGTLEEIVLTNSASGAGAPELLSINEFFHNLGIKAPDRLVRFLDKRFMFGIYSFHASEAFLLLKPISFGVVYAEMLDWEKDLPRVLSPLLAPSNLAPLPDRQAGSTCSFEDSVIRNIDVRVCKTDSGEVLLIYAFLPSKEELVIAPSVDTFTEVLVRSQTPRSVVQ